MRLSGSHTTCCTPTRMPRQLSLPELTSKTNGMNRDSRWGVVASIRLGLQAQPETQARLATPMCCTAREDHVVTMNLRPGRQARLTAAMWW